MVLLGQKSRGDPIRAPLAGQPRSWGQQRMQQAHGGWLGASLSGDHLLEGLFPIAPSHGHICAPGPAPQDIKMQLPCSKTRENAAKNPPPRVFRALGTRGLPRQPTVPAASVPGSHPGERAGF